MSGRIVVTGASGFIGRALVARLRESGRSVQELARKDLASTGTLSGVLAGADCVVHLAARAHRGGGDSDFEADVQLARSLARLSSQAGVRRLVHMSSIGVLGTSTSGTPFTDATMPSPCEPYARAKLRAEEAVQDELAGTAMDWVILRPTMVYGPHAPGNFDRLVRAVRRGLPLPFGSVRNRRFLIGIENLLDAIDACTSHPAASRRTFVVCDGEPVSTSELVTLIAKGLGVRPRLWPVPTSLLNAAALLAGKRRMAESLLRDLDIDSTGIRTALGWAPRVHAKDGIIEAAAASQP